MLNEWHDIKDLPTDNTEVLGYWREETPLGVMKGFDVIAFDGDNIYDGNDYAPGLGCYVEFQYIVRDE